MDEPGIQTYVDPPLAVRIDEFPAHSEVADALTLTAGGLFTVNVIVLDVAGLPLTPARLDVMIQVIVWRLIGLDKVNVGLFVPVLLPFTCH